MRGGARISIHVDPEETREAIPDLRVVDAINVIENVVADEVSRRKCSYLEVKPT